MDLALKIKSICRPFWVELGEKAQCVANPLAIKT